MIRLLAIEMTRGVAEDKGERGNNTDAMFVGLYKIAIALHTN